MSITGGNDGNLTINDLSKFKYLDMCVKEALRITPLAVLQMRHSSEDFEIGSYLTANGS